MQKTLYIVFHVTLLAIYLLRPAMPYIEYSIRKDYIAKYLCENRNTPKSCCHGTCYLKKQVKKLADTDPGTRDQQKISLTESKESLASSYRLPFLFAVCTDPPVYPDPLYHFSLHPFVFVPPRYLA